MILGRVIFLIVALLFGENYAEILKQRIIGGDKTQIQDYPYQVSLQEFTTHFCGGTIISKRHILTAAHCIGKNMKPPYRYFRVVMGTSLLNAGGESHHIARVDVHLDWIDSPKLSYQNDLAIITLASKIFFNAYKQKAKLPTKEVQDGEVADFTGWGLTLQTPKTRPKNLQRIKTTIVTNEKCRKKMVNGARLMIYKTQVCAFRTSGIGACSGDSGSPLVVNGEIVGIASWVRNKRCANGSPDVYTNVYAYKDYIESIIYRY